MNRFKYADSTLKRMTKDELIKYVKMCEYSREVAEENATQQYESFKKIVKDWKPVLRAEWVQTGEHDEYGRIICECSHCGHKIKLIVDDTDGQNYCPCCGAKMEGDKNEQID